MKTRLKLAAIALLFSTNAALVTAHALTTAFTYQGQLNDTGVIANGSYDLSFAAYDAYRRRKSGRRHRDQFRRDREQRPIHDHVDFGGGVFTGSDLWLEIAVSTNGANTFATIAPRQQFTPTPYALYAQTAGTATSAARER